VKLRSDLMKNRGLGFLILPLALAGGGCSTSDKRPLSDEERAEYVYELGTGSLQDNDPTGALIEFEKAQKLRPKWAEVHHAKAIAYHRKKDLKRAIQEAERAVELKPAFSDALTTLGNFYFQQKNYSSAKRVLSRAAKDPLYRGAYKPYTVLGLLAQEQGRDEEALRQYSEAIASNPMQSCLAYLKRGRIREVKGDSQGALDDYGRGVLYSCGRNQEAHLAKGLLLLKMGRKDEAREKLLEVRKLFPGTQVAGQAIKRLKEIN